MTTPTNDPHASGDISIRVVAQRLDMLQEGMMDIKAATRELTVAVTKLAVIEERQGQDRQNIDRAFVEIDKSRVRCEVADMNLHTTIAAINSRISVLENSAPMVKQTTHWVTGAVVGAAVLAVMFVVNKVGLG